MNTTIPFPDNPQHVENLNSIDKLKAAGFSGPDASLEISLFEYGIAWRDIGDEILFIYEIPGRDKKVFDRCSFKKNTNVLKEFDWVSWTSLFNTLGVSVQQWINFPLAQKIWDLFNYHGAENVFGSSYWEGFNIVKNPEEN
jgi:hypothetical protein